MQKRQKPARDITGDIGCLIQPVGKPPYPMYSYDRPAYLFWQGYYEAAIEAGFSHKQAMEILQSKHTRWALDARGDEVQALGREIFGEIFVSRKKRR